MFDRDDTAATLVQGGALDTPKLLVHPSLPNLSPQVRQQLANELLSGWKTDEELALSQYLYLSNRVKTSLKPSKTLERAPTTEIMKIRPALGP